MYQDYDIQLTIAMGNHFGPLSDWPESASYVYPYFTIIARSLEREEAAHFFRLARDAYWTERRAEGFAAFEFDAYLSATLPGVWYQDRVLSYTSALEAMKVIRRIVRKDTTADFERYIDCAVEACARGSRRQRRELASAS
ncbi:hypothetical protein [Streptomyces sp. NPDC020965]|uniref:hypothetical protein n=1 Tax=Streptomyces sp. NPDC020965 TaxID=3365105 RepID=UPI0037A06961